MHIMQYTQREIVSHIAARCRNWLLCFTWSIHLYFWLKCVFLFYVSIECVLGLYYLLSGCLYISFAPKSVGILFIGVSLSNIIRAPCHCAPGLTHWNGGRAERQGRAISALIAAVCTCSPALVLSACP